MPRPLVTLHRYYICSALMRDHYNLELEKYKQNLKSHIKNNAFPVELLIYMSIWYGTLYVVVEGWKELKLKNSEIDRLLANKNTKLLRTYRNGTFHFHKRYFNKKMTPIMIEPTSTNWIRQLDGEFNKFFMENLRS